MKKCIELKYHKNSKQEIVFENLDEIKEGDNVVLRLKDGDITPLYNYALDVFFNKIESEYIGNQIYLPFCFKTSLLRNIYYTIGKTNFNIFCFDSENLDNSDYNLKNILPKWGIPKDSAVLFLEKRDYNKYKEIYNGKYTQLDYSEFNDKNSTSRQLIDYNTVKQISIIIPQLHVENKNSRRYHKKNINKICKELKEKYGVERIELFVSHCFINLDDCECDYGDYCIGECEQYLYLENEYIDKITTTNSTGILEVQKSDRLEVIDCIEFFKD